MQKKNSFDKETMIKIGKGAMIAGGAAFMTYGLQAISAQDFGDMTPVVVALCGIGINMTKEYIEGK